MELVVSCSYTCKKLLLLLLLLLIMYFLCMHWYRVAQAYVSHVWRKEDSASEVEVGTSDIYREREGEIENGSILG